MEIEKDIQDSRVSFPIKFYLEIKTKRTDIIGFFAAN